MSYAEVMARGSAWLALAVSIFLLFVIAFDVMTNPKAYSRRDRRAAWAIGIVFLAMLWLGLAYAAGGGTVNQ